MLRRFKKLVSAARKGDPWAVTQFLDRCFGKPVESIKLEQHQGDITEGLTEDDIDSIREMVLGLTPIGHKELPN